MDVLLKALVDWLNAALEGWGILVLVVVAGVLFWGRYNFRIFFGENGGAEGDGERRERDLAARRRWIEERAFERRYLQLQGGGLARIAERWTRDAERLRSRPEGWSGRLFGVNPFTEGSYLLCLRLALVYPILGFIVACVLGGSGSLSGLPVLPDLVSVAGRWLLSAGMGLVAFLVWKGVVEDGRNPREPRVGGLRLDPLHDALHPGADPGPLHPRRFGGDVGDPGPAAPVGVGGLG